MTDLLTNLLMPSVIKKNMQKVYFAKLKFCQLSQFITVANKVCLNN